MYFARDAAYSAKDSYSPPDGRGRKRAFLARVLVGDTAVGTQVRKTPSWPRCWANFILL